MFSPNLFLNEIEKISGHRYPNTLSKYYNFEEYISTTESLGSDYVNLIHINIRSLRKNFVNLQSFLKCLPKSLDIVVITETWLLEHTKHLYSLEGYEPIHLKRTERIHGGGSICIRDILNFDLLSEFCNIKENIEICTTEIKFENTKYIISVVYRPHWKHTRINEFIEFLNQLLNNATLKHNKTIIIGDFNIHFLEHSTHVPTNLFLNFMHTINYFPHISRPTRIPDTPDLGQPSLLDHIWKKFSPPLFSGIIHYSISVHLPIFINMIQNHKQDSPKQMIKFRIFNTYYHNKFSNEVQAANWEELLKLNDTNDNFNTFCKIILSLYNNCFSTNTKFVSPKRLYNAWLTGGTLK